MKKIGYEDEYDNGSWISSSSSSSFSSSGTQLTSLATFESWVLPKRNQQHADQYGDNAEYRSQGNVFHIFEKQVAPRQHHHRM